MASMDKERKEHVLLAEHQRKVDVLHSPAADRNKAPILTILQQYLSHDQPLSVLEIASGSGQHVVHFASHLQNVTWQPSECDQPSINSINGYINLSRLQNIKSPVFLDTARAPAEWTVGEAGSYDAFVCVNMLHISEWQSTLCLFKGAGLFLKANGLMFIYGAFMFQGIITTESNQCFDQSLRRSNPDWGLRDVDDLRKLGEENDLCLENVVDMPANNHIIIFRKIQKPFSL